MYDVNIKNENISEIIHNHRMGYGLPTLASGQIVDAVNEISSFTFTVLPDNPCYENLYPFSTLIEVYNNKKSRNDFRGRVFKVDPSMDSSGRVYKTVTCEGELAYLQDSIQPYMEERQFEGDETRNGLEEFIDLILSNHNSQVEDYKKIYRGEITVTTFSTGGVYKSLNYETTFDIVKNKLIGSFGGEISLREAEGVLYLDYKENIGSTRKTTIELAKNMKDSSKELDPSSVVTRLIPLGEKITVTEIDENGNSTDRETEERLTVASVNDGKIYIDDDTAIAMYGVITGTVIYDDISDPSNLLSRGKEWLIDNNTIKASYKVTAVDLSLLGLDIDEFKLMDIYPVKNHLIGLNDTLEMIKKTTNILEPSASNFDLGDKEVLLSDMFVDYDHAINNVNQTISSVQSENKNNTNQVITNMTETISNVRQDFNEIFAEIQESTVASTEYETFKETIRNILSMDADNTTLIFQTINEAISAVNGNLESKWSELLTYFKFSSEGLIIGKNDSAITLTLENDVLTFKENGVSTGYLKDNKLYVYDGEFTHSLTLGILGFIPRSNGNTSIMKIK